MGGKRRKLPHERAGWKEMDMDPTPRKRGRRGANEPAGAAGASGYVPSSTGGAEGSSGLEGLTDLTKEQGEALARAFSEHEANAAADTSAAEAEIPGDDAGGSA